MDRELCEGERVFLPVLTALFLMWTHYDPTAVTFLSPYLSLQELMLLQPMWGKTPVRSSYQCAR